ncbi:erythromycin esterase family protein [Brachybacterium sp. AOP43-C2-M15]|uniref:erythromycin esterase family protein n=1 Tax=Brachybacterium sp. AOP43-C2-M15 TaxID=3457661 RepID=UPI0040346411
MSAALVDQLLPVLGEDGVLGLGEPTHGSANAFAWKFGIIHELARRGLLGALAFEESFTVGLRVDAVLRGDRELGTARGAATGGDLHLADDLDTAWDLGTDGDLDAAWDLGSSIWDTETIRAGMRELRVLTGQQPRERRTRFVGIDISKPYRTARALHGLGHRTPELRVVAERVVLDQGQVLALGTTCRRIESAAEEPAASLARNLRRHADAYLAAPDLSRLHRRDLHMARTLLENLPARGITVVWAHNEHLARNPDGFGGPAMGHVLRQELGARYHPVGVLCGEGTCRAVDPSIGGDGTGEYTSVPLPPARPGSTEHALRAPRDGVSIGGDAIDGASVVTAEEFTHPGPRRFLGWRIDTSLFADPYAVRETFEVDRPSSDFAALAYLPESIADVSWR